MVIHVTVKHMTKSRVEGVLIDQPKFHYSNDQCTLNSFLLSKQLYWFSQCDWRQKTEWHFHKLSHSVSQVTARLEEITLFNATHTSNYNQQCYKRDLLQPTFLSSDHIFSSAWTSTSSFRGKRKQKKWPGRRETVEITAHGVNKRFVEDTLFQFAFLRDLRSLKQACLAGHNLHGSLEEKPQD